MKPTILWQGWISAVQFLTIIPCGKQTHQFDPYRALAFFPICGLMIGIIAAIVDLFASMLWMQAISSLLVVIALAFVTGGLHLDGLTDTADGLYGQRDLEKVLTIMKDSRIGAIGAVTLFLFLTLKWLAIWGLNSDRTLWLLLVPAYARSSVLIGISVLPYGRPSGTGHGFFNQSLRWWHFIGMGFIFLLSFFSGLRMVVVNIGFVLLVVVILIYYHRKLGCITGDMLGAMIEAVETCLFLVLSAGVTLV